MIMSMDNRNHTENRTERSINTEQITGGREGTAQKALPGSRTRTRTKTRTSHYEMDACSGPVLGKMLLFALPLMASSVLQLLFNAADVIVVGKFAEDNALAAVGSNGSLINLMTNLFRQTRWHIPESLYVTYPLSWVITFTANLIVCLLIRRRMKKQWTEM